MWVVNTRKDIVAILEALQRYVYEEIEAKLTVGKTRSLARVSWREGQSLARVRVHPQVMGWPHPVVTGLLAHELAHPIVGLEASPEQRADRECVRRGLGVYLAVERAFLGRFQDEVLRRGADRYLGYTTLRSMLSSTEKRTLDRLIRDTGLVPRLGQTRSTATRCTWTDVATMIRLDGRRVTVRGAGLKT